MNDKTLISEEASAIQGGNKPVTLEHVIKVLDSGKIDVYIKLLDSVSFIELIDKIQLLPYFHKSNFSDENLKKLILQCDNHYKKKIIAEIKTLRNSENSQFEGIINKIENLLDKKNESSTSKISDLPPNVILLKEKDWTEPGKESARLAELEERADKCINKDNLQAEEDRKELAQILLKHVNGKTSAQIADVLAKVVSSQMSLESTILSLQEELKQKTDELQWIKENAPFIPPRPPVELPPKGELMTWNKYKANNPDKDIPDFLDEVWKVYIDAGLVHQKIFQDYDEPGFDRLCNYCKRVSVKESVRDFIPTIGDRLERLIKSMPIKSKRQMQRICNSISRYK